MMNYYEMKKRQATIKEYCKMFRKELTIFGGIVGEHFGLLEFDEYIRFMNELTEDEFEGNYLQNISNEMYYDFTKKLVDGEITFIEYVEEVNEAFTERFVEEMKRV